MTNGKTTAILSRFPDFFDAAQVENLFYKVVDAAGRGLEAAEVDLMRVLRAHHALTANNLDSQGLTSQKKGDLDKLFSLYLEALGGSSQLLQVSPTVQPGNLQSVSALVSQLATAAPDTLDGYLWQRVQAYPKRYDILPRYTVEAARLTPECLGLTQPDRAAHFLESLAGCQDALTQRLRQKHLSAALQQQLATYHSAAAPETTALAKAVLDNLQGNNLQMLRDPGLFRAFQQQQQQRQLRAALAAQYRAAQQIAQDDALSDRQISQLVSIAHQLRRLLPMALDRALRGWGDRVLTAGTWQQVSQALQTALAQPSTAQRLLQILTGPVPALSPPVADLWAFEYRQVYPTLIKVAEAALAALLPPGEAMDERTLANLARDHAIARGDDLVRFNRRLLPKAYPRLWPHGRSAAPPGLKQVKQTLAKLFNQVLTDAAELYQQFSAEFDALELGLEAETLIAQQPLAAADRLRLNRLLLEAAYPLYLERSETPYRERLQNLIKVLRQGAASQEGIVQIVAANLGMPIERSQPVKPWEQPLFTLPPSHLEHLAHYRAPLDLRQAFAKQGYPLSTEARITPVDNSPSWTVTDLNQGEIYRIHRTETVAELEVYRYLIRVLDYSPRPYVTPPLNLTQTEDPAAITCQVRPVADPGRLPAAPEHTLSITNPNPTPVVPRVDIRFKRGRLPLSSFRLVPLTPEGADTLQCPTGKDLVVLNQGDVLSFLSDGSIYRNSVQLQPPKEEGLMFNLPAGPSAWQIMDSQVGLPEVRFDQARFDFAQFDQTNREPITPDQAQDYLLEVNVSFTRLTPGTFVVKVPWHLEGYTDKFAETRDHPRHQIKPLIERVKAAGTQCRIDYEYTFEPEPHHLDDPLYLTGTVARPIEHLQTALLDVEPTLQETGTPKEAWSLAGSQILASAHTLLEPQLAVAQALGETHPLAEQPMTFSSDDMEITESHAMEERLQFGNRFDSTRFDDQYFET